MKKLIFATLLVFAISSPVFAWNLLETTDEARERHSNENYEHQEKYGTPLGGYEEKLGDPSPDGTDRPGYTYDKGEDSSEN